MEKAQKTIARLFTVIVVVIAMLLCGVFLGCGVAPSDETGKLVDSTDTINPDDNNGDEPDGDSDFNDYVNYPDPGHVSVTGLGIKAEMEERVEYAIDDISLDLIYGVDITQFNRFANEWSSFAQDEVGHIYVSAFNVADHFEMDDSERLIHRYVNLGETLSEIGKGEVKDSALLIDEIPCRITNEYMLYDEIRKNYLNADNLRGTEYEGSVSYFPYELTCYKRNRISIPRELFTSDEGSIEIGIYVFISNAEGVSLLFPNYCYMYPDADIHFDYKITGEKVELSNIMLRDEFVRDGTKSVAP